MTENTPLDDKCCVCARTIFGPTRIHTEKGVVHSSCLSGPTIDDPRIASLTAEVERLTKEAEAELAKHGEPGETIASYFARQIEWSRETFGPGLRTGGVLDHIAKECCEVRENPHDLSEWVDLIILSMDGFWRHGGTADDLLPRLLAKQQKNMARTWPDWRTMPEDKAIEHDRSAEDTPPASAPDVVKAFIDDFADHHNGCDRAQPDCSCGMRGRYRGILSALDTVQEPVWRPTHRHKKRGGEYMLLGVGKMQSENWEARHPPVNGSDSGIRPVDMREVAIYRGEDGQHWVRPVEEFNDGRFEALPAAPKNGEA